MVLLSISNSFSMGFSLFRRRDPEPSSAAKSTSNPSPLDRTTFSTNASFKEPLPYPIAPTSKLKPSASTQFFRSIRKASSPTLSDRPLQSPSPLSLPYASRPRTSSTPNGRSLKVDTNLSRQPLDTVLDYSHDNSRDANNWSDSPTSTIGHPSSSNRGLKSFIGLSGRLPDTASTISLPLYDSRNTVPESEAEGKKSRWNLGRAHKRKPSTVDSFVVVGDKDKIPVDDGGFVVKSFRVVSRVQEGPMSSGSHDSLTKTSPRTSTAAGGSLPPSLATFESSNGSLGPYRPSSRQALDGEQAPSPTISVEAFRLASARSRSTASLTSLGSPGTGEEGIERPRFQPRRSSVLFDSASSVSSAQPLAPPRPTFAGRPLSQTTSRESFSSAKSTQVNSSRVPTSTSSPDFAYTTASEGDHDDCVSKADRPDSELWDEELKLIALYGASERPPAQRASSSSRSPPPLSGMLRPTSPSPKRLSLVSNPSFHVQPASPSNVPSSTSSSTRPEGWGARSPPSWRNSSASFLKSNLSNTRKAGPVWDESSDDEDDVPLARLSAIKAASTSDLRLGNGLNALELGPEIAGKASQKTDLEVLTSGGEQSSSTKREALQSSLGVGRPSSTLIRGPGTQRRSMSTLSFSTNPSFAAPISVNAVPRNAPELGHRTYSSPAAPPSAAAGFSTHDLLLLAPTSSPSPEQRNSSSSGSTSDSGSYSLPITPKDQSPAVSTIGLLRPSFSTDKIVKFDVQSLSLSNDSERKWSNRLSSQQPLPKRSSMAISTTAGEEKRTVRNSQSSLSLRTTPLEPSNADLKSTRRLSSMPLITEKGKPAEGTAVFERMKARHKAETLKAITIGKDLNGPGDLDDLSDDDETPLSTLPSRSATPQSNRGSTYGLNQMQQQQYYQQQQQQQSFYPPPSTMGGYSQLASAPPGVDPYLYASLPPDQKLGLHARAQQMMQMMQGFSLQAQAESTIGYGEGSQVSGHGSEAGGAAGGGEYGMYGGPQMGFGGTGYGYPQMNYGGYSSMPGSRLPPFAPSMASSQPFFQQPQAFFPNYPPPSSNFGGYASSDVGVTSGSGGVGRSHRPVRGRAAASVIGTGRR